MESSASTSEEIPNEENSSIVSNPQPPPSPSSETTTTEYSEKVSKRDVEVKREVTTKIKRVSFHFGSNSNSKDNKDVILNTIQNIYDTKTETNSNEETNLVRSNSSKSRINKSAYVKLHRHSFSTTGNSSVDKLKGRYEFIAKQQTDNNLKANIVTRAKANTDKSSTNDVKTVSESDKQIESEPDQKLKYTEKLKSEFINSSISETEEDKEETPKTTSEKDTKSCENLLLRTTSNIEKLQNNLSTRLSLDTIEKLRTKYSPASYGYPRDTSSKIPKKVQFSDSDQPTKIPVPTPRTQVKPQDNKEDQEIKPSEEKLDKTLNKLTEIKATNQTEEKLDENLNKKEVQSVTVKLVTVPDTPENIDQIDSTNPANETKDVNSNTIVSSSDLKSRPPLPAKPKLPEKISEDKLNDNYIEEITGIEIEVTYDKIQFAEPEAKHFIERHSSSEDSVDKLESFFSEIVMDKKPKEKKRSNSFRKMLTGGLFGRDKKKSDEEKSKQKKKDNTIFADNAQNESQAFDRNSSHRHTIDNSFPRRDTRGNNAYHPNQSEGSGPLYYYSPPTQSRRATDDTSLRNRYTEMKGSFMSNNHSSYSPEEYVPMDNGTLNKSEIPQRTYMNVNKYIDTSSSSSNTLDSENRNCTYQNALIAQAEMRQLRENENLQRNSQKSGIPLNVNKKNTSLQENRYLNIDKHSNSPEMFRDTPQDSSQNLQLVKPKALIPINSERPLPNPYHNNQDIDSSNNYENYDDKTLDRNLNVDNLKHYPQKNNLYARSKNTPDKTDTSRPVVMEEIYGTVFDSITPQSSSEYLRNRSLSPEQNRRPTSNRSSPNCKSPSSPRSLEASKLRLPSNREKIELQPRIKSPIPQAKISTDKIIATELLRNKSSPVSGKSTPNTHRSPIASPTIRPAVFQESNIYENSPDNQNSRSPLMKPNAQSTPQAVMKINNDYVYLRNKPPMSTKDDSIIAQYSPREASVAECLEAAEWQMQQRELDKSPALENPQQITTNVLVHVNPEEQYVSKNIYPSPSPTLRQKSPINHVQVYARQEYQPQQPSPRSTTSSLSNVRPHTPLQQPIPSPNSKSPDKQHMLHNVEAFYWRELRKLKDKEEHDLLRYRQQQLHVYGYVEDPVLTRRSRSASPSVQRGRRSLSLPREIRPMPNTITRAVYPGPEAIPEGKPVIAKKPIQLPSEPTYGQVRQPLQRNPNFIRNTFERSTIGPIGTNRYPTKAYENYYLGDGRVSKSGNQPIFKRGSLISNVTVPDSQSQASKKVSFSKPQDANKRQGWPTKNGFTKSPPTRRIELPIRETSVDDDVFLPNSPRMPQNRNMDEVYGYYSNITQNPQQIYQNASGNDALYASRLPRPEFDYSTGKRAQEGLYGKTGAKQTTVSNKVCDIYGQIHEPNQGPISYPRKSGLPPNVIPQQNYGQIKQMGLIYGQIQPNPDATVGRSYNHLNSPQQTNFVRGTRLTASVNDMYKRYPRYEVDPRYYQVGEEVIVDASNRPLDSRYHQAGEKVIVDAPNRPLPPLPERKDVRAIPVKKNVSGYVLVSDTESGSEAGEVQRILQSGVRQKNFSVIEEEWNSDGKSGRASGNESGKKMQYSTKPALGGSRGENEGEIKSSRSRSARREDPRRHTLSGDQHYTMAGQGGPLSRTMDLEGQFPRGYPHSSNAMLFDDDPGIMSEVETSSTGFRRGGKQRSSLPVVRTPSKTLERPLDVEPYFSGLVFLQYRNETKRALLPNEITSIDTVKALFVRSFPKQLSMEYLDSPLVKIYIHDSSKDMFYELEDVRSHLREIRDRSVLRLFESTDVSGGLPMGGVGIPGGIGHFEDPSYFSEPEFDSEYQHQHIHKSKGSAGKGAPYYMGSTTSLPRGGPLLRPYSPAVGTLPPDRMKTLPAGAPPKPQRAYSSGATRASDGSSRPPDRFAPFQRPANPLFNLPDGYMSSPERGSRGYEDPYYSQYTSRSGSITPVIDEEVSDTELLDEQYSLYGVKLAPGGPRRSQFPGPAAPPYDTTRLRVEHMERQLANLTGLVQKALTQTPTPRDFLAPPSRDAYRSDDSYLRSDSNKAPKLGKTSCHKSVSFEKSVSFSDEPPDMNSPKQHSPQHSEKDRLKPAPPPKPASLSPGQYDSRHIYRDLQLTPEMYNQLRGLQKKAKDLRAEVRNLRRMSQAQAHSVRETIRDTFIKIRAMLMAGGEQVWQAGMDQERVRLSRDEDLYKQEMLRLETDLTDLEASVEELRGNVINRKTRVNMSDVENMALVLSKSSKTVADLKLRFPGLQDSLKAFLSSEMDKVVREEKFLKEEPERLESALRRCKKLTGTLVTLKRLASVQEQRLPCSTGATDGRISPNSITETPPITPTSGQHSKPPSGACVGQVSFGGDGTNTTDSNQRPENALDALLDELQTFSKPHSATVNTQMPQASYSDSTPSDPPAIPVKGIPPSHSAHFGYPSMSEIGRKGSMDSASILPTQNLTVSTATGSLRRLHSYPSGSDTDNSPPIQPLRTQMDGRSFSKPPIPERNAELLQHITSGRRVPPPPPPRTSSKSPLASPTSPSLPPRSPATGLQHIQNVQNMTEKPQSQFEAATQNLGLGTLRRNVPNRSSMKDNNKAQTLPRNIGSNLQIHTQATATSGELQNVSSSSCESVNSQDGTKKGSRKEELEQRHQELLKKQKALQEQYARLQQLQRGNNTLAVVPPAPDQLLKKTGSESNLLQNMGLQMATTQMTGSLTHLPSTTTSSTTTGNNTTNTAISSTNPIQTSTTTTTTTDTTTDNSSSSSTTTTSKVYETDIL